MCSSHFIFIQIISFKIIIHDLLLILQSYLSYFTQAYIVHVCLLSKCIVVLVDPLYDAQNLNTIQHATKINRRSEAMSQTRR